MALLKPEYPKEALPSTKLEQEHLEVVGQLECPEPSLPLEFMPDRFEAIKFFERQKARCANPTGVTSAENHFVDSLLRDGTTVHPIYTLLSHGRLEILDKYDPEYIEALAIYVEHLLSELKEEKAPAALVQ